MNSVLGDEAVKIKKTMIGLWDGMKVKWHAEGRGWSSSENGVTAWTLTQILNMVSDNLI